MLTFADLLISMRNRLRVEMEQRNQEALHNLRNAFDEMLDASYGDGNEKVCALLEDLSYAASHTLMGADFKARDAIPTDEQIMAAFRSDEQK